jgi:hypothetical protein
MMHAAASFGKALVCGMPRCGEAPPHAVSTLFISRRGLGAALKPLGRHGITRFRIDRHGASLRL